MSLRIIALSLIVLFLMTYSWRNWFNALLGAIVLFAFLDHPDMPRSIAGVPGLTLWNLLMLVIVVAWLNQRIDEDNMQECPKNVRVAFYLYITVVVIACVRAFIDPSRYYDGTRFDILMEYLVNSLRFLLPALMLFDGCRSRERVLYALAAILSLYFILALLSIKAMGLHFDLSSGSELSSRAARVLSRNVGYHRVDLSMMFAGASWAVIAFSRQFDRLLIKLTLWGSAGIFLLGLAVTGGRTGYVTWGLIGLFLCMVRWRKLLVLIPVVVAAVITFIPAVRERMLQGFGQQKGGIVFETDTSSITSGRTDLWPRVIEEIGNAPVLGYGRIGFIRSGLRAWAQDHGEEAIAHPHNAYLEMLLDNGLLGSCCAMPIYILLLRRSFQLFVDREDVLCEVTGGIALSLVIALFAAAIGAQTFYPREGVVGMWAALAVALRLSVQRQWVGADASRLEPERQDDEDDDSTEEWTPIS